MTDSSVFTWKCMNCHHQRPNGPATTIWPIECSECGSTRGWRSAGVPSAVTGAHGPSQETRCARDSDWCDGFICREHGIYCPNAMADAPIAEPPSVWLAYHSDYSDAVVFSNEHDCLRYAVENFMQVKRLYYGDSIKVERES